METILIEHWLAGEYLINGPINVTLLRSYTNDVYLVRTPREAFVLKLYSKHWRTEEEVAWEIDLVDYIRAKGIFIPAVVRGKDNRALHVFDNRWAVLFAYAPGEKPVPPFSPELYQEEGKALAAIHNASDDFTSTNKRSPLDVQTLIERPMALIEPLIANRHDRHFLSEIALFLKNSIEQFAQHGLDWGVVHADVTLDNLHITDDHNVVFYDFDSAGFGWRALDLQGWVVLRDERKPHIDAFLNGYQEARPLHDIDVEATPYLFAANEIWGMEIDLQMRILKQGDKATAMYLQEKLRLLQTWSEYFKKTNK